MPPMTAKVQFIGEAHIGYSRERKELLGSMLKKTSQLKQNLWQSMELFHHIMRPYISKMEKETPGSPAHERIKSQMQRTLNSHAEPGRKAVKMIQIIEKLQQLNKGITNFRKMTIKIAQDPIKWHEPDTVLLEHNFEDKHDDKVEEFKEEYSEYTRKVGNIFRVYGVDIFHDVKEKQDRTLLRNIGILLSTNDIVRDTYRANNRTVNVTGVFGAGHLSARIGTAPTLQALFHFQHDPIFFKNKVIPTLRKFAEKGNHQNLTKTGKDLVRIVNNTKNDKRLHEKLTHKITYQIEKTHILLDEDILEHRRKLNTITKSVEEAVNHVYDSSLGGHFSGKAVEKLGDIDLSVLNKVGQRVDNLTNLVNRITTDYKDSMSRQTT